MQNIEGLIMVDQKITQCMKPHGEEGIQTIRNMNENHKNISEFAFESIDINEDDRILDIGCGGGVNIEKFLKLTTANVDGLDYSEVSVKASIKQNQQAVDNGRCNIIQADVSDMPIDNDTYDLVSSFETIYFWPDIGETFKEVFRIIKPDGRFMIAQGTDGTHPDDEKWLATVEGMSVYNASQLKEYLINAGFKSVEIFKKENDYILVVIAKR